MNKPVKYKDIRNQLKSFDYLNCVDKITWNPKSWFWHLIGHTARVYVDERTGVVYVYESTTLNKNGASGVQLTLMSDWIKTKKHQHVFLRQISNTGGMYWRMRNCDFEAHIKKYRGTPYPDLSQWRWRWYMANASLDLKGDQPKLENEDQDHHIYCTMLSFHLDRDCETINEQFPDGTKVNPAESEPDNTRPGCQDWLPDLLVDGITVGDEIELVA